MRSDQKTFSKQDRFVGFIKDIYPELADEIIESLKAPRTQTFRLNNKKISEDLALSQLRNEGFDVESGPLPLSYIVRSSKNKLSESRLVDEGCAYIQSLSSMLDVFVVAPTDSDDILDLCAAPGSKTSLLSITAPNSTVTAVDNNLNRFHQLKKNVETQGVTNVIFMLENASTLPYKHPGLVSKFTKILADVPCSNEGTFRLDGSFKFDSWNSRSYKHLPVLQKKLVYAAYTMLAPGGALVYSTCTYHPEENEEVVDWLLQKAPDLHLSEVPLSKDIPHVSGFGSWKNKKFASSMSRCVRIIPTALFDGFFIAKLIKNS